MHSGRVMFMLTAVLSVCVFTGGSANGQLWIVDLGNSNIQIDTSAFADDFGVPGVDQDADLVNFLNPNFVAPAGTFDYGNAVTSIARDGGMTSSSNAFVTVDGELSNALQVRWSANTLNDSELPNDGFFGNATASAGLSVAATLTGLNAGQNYLMRVDFHYEGEAITDHEAVLEDLEEALGSLSFTFDGNFQPVFSQLVNSDLSPGVPGSVNITSSVLVPFAAGGNTADLIVEFDASSFSQLNPPNLDDLSGSYFFGDATFTVIPEPAAFVLLTTGSVVLIRRRPSI